MSSWSQINSFPFKMDVMARIRSQKQLLGTATSNKVHGSNRESFEDSAISNAK